MSVNTTSTPPLVRHPTLRPLSREHMNGLVIARALVRADGPDARRTAVERFRTAWASEIAAHFDDEERLLLPLGLPAHLAHRLRSDHAAIRALWAQLDKHRECAHWEPRTVRLLGLLLRRHIRWEERVLFEAIQREHPGALNALAAHADAIEAARPASRPRRLLAWGHGGSSPRGAQG